MIIPTLLFAASLRTHQDSPTAGRRLVYSVDFRKTHELSDADWKFNDGPVYNKEQETYTSKAAGNAYFKDGCLVLEARKEGSKITSARLESVKSWKYGYFEVEAKVPDGKGTWPAIWMLNDRLRNPGPQGRVDWPKCGEIDIMENVGFDPPNFHFSLHSDKYNWMKPAQRTKVVASPDPLKFHKFGLDWRPDSITFTLDGKGVYRVENAEDTYSAWPFREPFYMILNLAIGGTWGGQKGVDPAIFPSRFYIRNVKIYQ